MSHCPNRLMPSSSPIGPVRTPTRLATIAAGTALLIGLGGCGGGDADPSPEDQQSNRSVAAGTGMESGTGGRARQPGHPSAPADAALSQRVNAAWAYAVGGDTDPTSVFPCAGAAKDIEGLSALRAALAASLTTIRGACTPASQGTAVVGGQTVGVYKVNCEDLDHETARSVWNISSSIEACWPGAGALWRIGPWKWSRSSDSSPGEPRFDLEMLIDPEPATLQSDLSGIYGVSAPAMFIYSRAPTSAYYWPNAWKSAAYGPAAGAPCSPNPVLAAFVDGKPTYASYLTMTIQVAGNWRRCI